MKQGASRPAPILSLWAVMIVTALIFPLVLGLAMKKGLNHDEHQHIAAGALVAREGLRPYLDFPHFHTPYLAYIYAALFHVTDQLLLAARLFTTLCASIMVGLVGGVAWALFRGRGRWLAGWACAGAVLLCITAGLFTQTVGRAWNHEPSLLFAVLAFISHIAGIERQQRGWLIGSGVLLGVAIGIRLTYAPLVAPFALALFFYPIPRWRIAPLLSFTGGLFLGSLGFILLFAAAPEQTFFGTFEFAKVNVIYRLSGEGAPRTMTFLTKIRYLWKEVVRHELPLLAVALLPSIAAYWDARRTARVPRFELRFILLLLPFLLFGSFAPSPLFFQYFFPFIPFLILAGLYAVVSIEPGARCHRATLSALLVSAALSAVLGGSAYWRLREPFSVKGWTPIKLHQDAANLRSILPAGRLLTLAPIHPLEAGLLIYPAFATGPFAWRVSSHVEAAKAARIGLITPETLTARLEAVPPAALLLGFENTEVDLKNYARSHGYLPVPLDEHTLWVAPVQHALELK
ncbi:MAG: hypothetical protein JWL59_697 [Chthoniobacteraceae bacterium]|nr:hypothetical protein [Chthoniobacteraceae bacterium]